MYIKRTAEEMIRTVSKSFPCIVVYGPRQVGKSTTIDMMFGDKYRKVTLDDSDDRVLAQSNPKLFLENYRCPLIIDVRTCKRWISGRVLSLIPATGSGQSTRKPLLSRCICCNKKAG